MKNDLQSLIDQANNETAARYLSDAFSRKIRSPKTWKNVAISFATAVAVQAGLMAIHHHPAKGKTQQSAPAAVSP